MASGNEGRAYDEHGNVRPADERFLGKGDRTGGVLRGADLDAAVAEANESGAGIKVSGTADEKRAALEEFHAANDEDED